MKVAISVPDPLFEAAEKLAKVRSVPRSQLYSEALSHYVSAHSADEVTQRLNQVYGNQPSGLDAAMLSAQLGVLENESW